MRTQPQARATKQQARIVLRSLRVRFTKRSIMTILKLTFETSRLRKKVVNFEHVDFCL